ncbi:hypothetical protein [Streptomyces specialis]|uniref:hypothetical protein n=1 Tax=Streptomyces specialis TaxID=498367 RepID=UPI001F222C3D|nr:hypothetical protein [Streptomyces specialis]
MAVAAVLAGLVMAGGLAAACPNSGDARVRAPALPPGSRPCDPGPAAYLYASPVSWGA